MVAWARTTAADRTCWLRTQRKIGRSNIYAPPLAPNVDAPPPMLAYKKDKPQSGDGAAIRAAIWRRNLRLPALAYACRRPQPFLRKATPNMVATWRPQMWSRPQKHGHTSQAVHMHFIKYGRTMAHQNVPDYAQGIAASINPSGEQPLVLSCELQHEKCSGSASMSHTG